MDALKDPHRARELAGVRGAVESLVSDYDTRRLGAKFKKWKDRVIRNSALKLGDLQDGYRRWKVQSSHRSEVDQVSEVDL